MKQKWQIQMADWLGSKEHGLIFLGARRNSRGVWQTEHQIPRELTQLLGLYQRPHHSRWFSRNYHNAAEMREHFPWHKLQRSLPTHAYGIVELEVKPRLLSDLKILEKNSATEEDEG